MEFGVVWYPHFGGYMMFVRGYADWPTLASDLGFVVEEFRFWGLGFGVHIFSLSRSLVFH